MARVAHFLRSVRLFNKNKVLLAESLKHKKVGAFKGQSPCGQETGSCHQCLFLFAPGFSGFPETVPVYTVNRQCSSGLQALLNIAGKS